MYTTYGRMCVEYTGPILSLSWLLSLFGVVSNADRHRCLNRASTSTPPTSLPGPLGLLAHARRNASAPELPANVPVYRLCSRGSLRPPNLLVSLRRWACEYAETEGDGCTEYVCWLKYFRPPLLLFSFFHHFIAAVVPALRIPLCTYPLPAPRVSVDRRL